EDGRTFTGSAYGAVGETVGEAVFVTAMSGYQETLTDPSYHRQIVIQTAPHIGNTGINAADDESRQIWVSGYVVRDASRISSNWRSEGDLETHLAEAGVVGIKDVDTRAVTRHLRDKGGMRMGIFSGPAAEADAALNSLTLAAPDAPFETIDLGGKAVIPGFVDSHNHLVFAGDRSAEFAARMAGEKYSAGGIATTVAATRAATDEELEANLVHLVDQATRQGTTTFEIKSGYGLTRDDEIRALEIIGRHTPESTLIAAHVVPPEYKADPEAYVALVIDEIIPA
ncbi:carbamoyl-phosphate synthase domain-containing protein, partial [Burkholderia multivorans]|uniref:carbamoyl-phosphate synthase domain-containing protein n=1 Tax=Burkholderia multivorans TaxID=87883 RepID=UPI001C65EC7C